MSTYCFLRLFVGWWLAIGIICISNVSLAQSSIVQAEYFFDTDPGLGQGINLAFTSDTILNIQADISTAGLGAGFHTLFIRFKDADGVWSFPEAQMFAIESNNNTPVVTTAEFYFDNDSPQSGKRIPINFNPVTQLDTTVQLGVSGLTNELHLLKMRVRDNLGNWSLLETKEFLITPPRVDTITPASGGNIGDVTINILGASFDEGTTVKLTLAGQPDIIVPDTLLAIINGEQIQATLDLRGRTVGEYDVEILLGNGTKFNISKGFRVESGVQAEPWAEIIGFDRIRPGQWQTYTVVVGNKGNINATGIPLWIAISGQTEYELDFKLEEIKDSLIDMDSLAIVIPIDTLFGETFEGNIIALTIPVLPSNRTFTYNLKIKTLASMQIGAWVSKPMYRDSEINNGRLASVSESITKEQVNCLLDVSFATLGVIPGAGCVSGVFDHYWRPRFNSSAYGDVYEGTPVITDLVLLQWIANCLPGKSLYKASRAILSTTMKRVFRKSLKGIDNLNNDIGDAKAIIDCYNAFFPPNKEPKKIPIRTITSFDPNDKLGSLGAGSKNYIAGDAPFQYLIRFENKASASAAAQTVIIVDTLDKSKLDLSTLQLGFMSFNDRYINVPAGRRNYTAEVDLRPGMDLFVKVEAKLDENTGILTWKFSSLDPATRQPTENPDAGFLPPNLTAPEGEGGVFYTIRPKADLVTDIDIKNKAYIFFDNNEVIPTPTWSNTVDRSLPLSKVASLPEIQSDTTFTVSWSGSDEGAGVSYYSIYVSVNNNPYKIWVEGTSEKSASFTGKIDSTYRFYSIAQDSTGNVEVEPVMADATTTITKVTGVEEELANQVKVYPNPTSSSFTIELPELLRKSTFSLTNAQGQQIKFHDSKNQLSIVVNVGNLSKGLYLLLIHNDKISVTKKIIIR